jgi:hypothetical protein
MGARRCQIREQKEGGPVRGGRPALGVGKMAGSSEQAIGPQTDGRAEF